MDIYTRGNYSYEADDTDSNVVLLYCTDELMRNSSVDPLRKELGFVFAPAEFTATNGSRGVELVAQAGTFTMETEALRDFRIVKMTTNSKYIDYIEIMPSKITPINSKALFPNYKIPVRLYANEETTSNDRLWRILFTGGSY